jgi:hypothetical protein
LLLIFGTPTIKGEKRSILLIGRETEVAREEAGILFDSAGGNLREESDEDEKEKKKEEEKKEEDEEEEEEEFLL